MNLKIGILLARSDMFPVLGFDFLNGLKMAFSKNSKLIPELIIESIGNAADDSIGRFSEKLLLQENVDIEIAFCGYSHINQLVQLFDSYQKPLIHVDLGGNICENNNKSPYVIHHTLNLWQSCYLAGAYAAKEMGKKKAAVTASFYDGGYQLIYGFVKGFVDNGGEVVYNYVSPMNYEDSSFDVMIDGIISNKADVVFAAFSYKEAELVYSKIKKSGLYIKTPFIVTPIMTDESYHKTNHELSNVYSVASWSFNDDYLMMKKFIKEYNNSTHNTPSVFSLLGYETGLSIIKLYEDIETKNNSEIKDKLTRLSFNSPRGTITYNQFNEVHVPEHKLRSLVYQDNQYQNKVVKKIDFPSKPILNEKDAKDLIFAGWKNPYICT